ncbi:MAG TPA: SUMF1/EgtB/PvdO family nonheme iron enzyme [Polyangiaceae bacterium]|nr:SUMF1/EgtB/PvdO family nonheme iron enzyme [Polyangiaceae bacterium]
MTHARVSFGCLLAIAACSNSKSPLGDADSSGANGGTGNSSGGSGGLTNGSGGAPAEPTPRFHPPPGFESCVHAKVEAHCTDGWCTLPPSCFVMGSPETEWRHGLYTEDLTAVTLTHSIEVQQKEFTRAEWETIVGAAPPPDACEDVDCAVICDQPNCPVANVSWWDALHVANLLSAQNGHSPCYQPVGCTGSLGVDLDCTGVAAPNASVYECEGYRLPTRAEAEYAARAGTISTFYSGDIVAQEDATLCLLDPALETIAWYCNNSGGRAHLGGELEPNGFGLYDTIGNINEWTNEDQSYSSSPGGSDPRGAVGDFSHPARLVVGGQYTRKAYLCRPASLLSIPAPDRGPALGLRLVRTLP